MAVERVVMDVACGTPASQSKGWISEMCVRVFDVYVLWLCCSDGGSTETHLEDYCCFVVDNFVNQQFSNRLADVPACGSWRYICELELVS